MLGSVAARQDATEVVARVPNRQLSTGWLAGSSANRKQHARFTGPMGRVSRNQSAYGQNIRPFSGSLVVAAMSLRARNIRRLTATSAEVAEASDNTS